MPGGRKWFQNLKPPMIGLKPPESTGETTYEELRPLRGGGETTYDGSETTPEPDEPILGQR